MAKMQFDIITAFPETLRGGLETSIPSRAVEANAAEYHLHDLRDFTTDKHRQIDDQPYGGGPGMILKPEPFFRAVEEIRSQCTGHQHCEVIFPTPQGVSYSQRMARRLTESEHLIFLCGHYKGVDERVRESLVTLEISIGDYVLSGGELPAMVIIDSVVRLLPGVLQDPESADSDSFETGLLDGPHYTRPEVFRGMEVPGVLLSGHHGKISEWKALQRRIRTEERRADLMIDDTE